MDKEGFKFMNIRGHLKTINHHKYLVTRMCFKVGLYKQGILHDLSKYHPKEFIPGILYYQGDKSPYHMEKRLHRLSKGWLHHKGRNMHHFEYWIDISPEKGEGWVGMKMPKRYVAEMCIDRICACKNYQKEAYTDRSALDYYMRGHEILLIDKETDFLTQYLLSMLADKGEEKFLRYMKKVLLKNINGDYHVVDGELVLE